MSDNGELGVLLALAYVSFVSQRDTALTDAGHPGLGRYFGFVLRAVEEEPLSLSVLAERLEMTRPGALKIVEEIVDAGYLKRLGDSHDGRVRSIALTPRGVAALSAARQVQIDLEARLVARFGAEQVAATRAVLAAVAEDGPDSVPRFLRSMS